MNRNMESTLRADVSVVCEAFDPRRNDVSTRRAYTGR